jgi:hypothetical protein
VTVPRPRRHGCSAAARRLSPANRDIATMDSSGSPPIRSAQTIAFAQSEARGLAGAHDHIDRSAGTRADESCGDIPLASVRRPGSQGRQPAAGAGGPDSAYATSRLCSRRPLPRFRRLARFR